MDVLRLLPVLVEVASQTADAQPDVSDLPAWLTLMIAIGSSLFLAGGAWFLGKYRIDKLEEAQKLPDGRTVAAVVNQLLLDSKMPDGKTTAVTLIELSRDVHALRNSLNVENHRHAIELQKLESLLKEMTGQLHTISVDLAVVKSKVGAQDDTDPGRKRGG